MSPGPCASHDRPREAARGPVIPGMSHPDESDVSLLFFQAVVFHYNRDGVVLSAARSQSPRHARKEAVLYGRRPPDGTQWAAPTSGRMECSGTIHETAAETTLVPDSPKIWVISCKTFPTPQGNASTCRLAIKIHSFEGGPFIGPGAIVPSGVTGNVGEHISDHHNQCHLHEVHVAFGVTESPLSH